MRPSSLIRPSFLLVALALAGCDSESSSAIERYGAVTLSLPRSEPPSLRASAFFAPAVSRDEPNCGISGATANCQFWACDEELYTAPLPTSGLSAGAIALSGSQPPVELLPDENGRYGFESELREPPWREGDALSVHVAGSREFPELTASVSAPAPELEVSAPSDSELVFNEDEPFSFTWTPLASGDVNIAIGTETTTTSGEARISAALFCHYAAANGAATVSSDVIAALPKPPGLTRYTVDIFLFSGVDVGRAGAALSFQVTTVGYSGHATFE